MEKVETAVALIERLNALWKWSKMELMAGAEAPVITKQRKGKGWKRGVCVGQGDGMVIILKNGWFQWGTALNDKEHDLKKVMAVVNMLLRDMEKDL